VAERAEQPEHRRTAVREEHEAHESEDVVHGILRVVNRVRRRSARRPRVYTIWIVPLVLALALARAAVGVEMLGDITVEPTMVKGPATAPVTIVEFSDYQ
jgi:hypothetical protein